jgi:hypothetical protein
MISRRTAIVGLLVIAAGTGLGSYFWMTAPSAEERARRKREKQYLKDFMQNYDDQQRDVRKRLMRRHED